MYCLIIFGSLLSIALTSPLSLPDRRPSHELSPLRVGEPVDLPGQVPKEQATTGLAGDDKSQYSEASSKNQPKDKPESETKIVSDVVEEDKQDKAKIKKVRKEKPDSLTEKNEKPIDINKEDKKIDAKFETKNTRQDEKPKQETKEVQINTQDSVKTPESENKKPHVNEKVVEEQQKNDQKSTQNPESPKEEKVSAADTKIETPVNLRMSYGEPRPERQKADGETDALADRQLADRQLADRQLTDRQLADRQFSDA